MPTCGNPIARGTPGIPPAPPKYGGPTSKMGRDGSNVLPPSFDDGHRDVQTFVPDHVLRSVRRDGSKNADDRAIVVAGPAGVCADARRLAPRLSSVGRSAEQYDRLVDLPFDPCNIQVALVRARACVSTQMRGMSSSLMFCSSPFHARTATGSLSHVLPPSGDRRI